MAWLLSRAVTAPGTAGGGCAGAMHSAAASRCGWACSWMRSFGVEREIKRLRLKGSTADAYRRSKPPKLHKSMLQQYLKTLKARDDALDLRGQDKLAQAKAPYALTSEEKTALLVRYLPDENEATQRLRKLGHRWMWRWIDRRDWKRWDACLERMKADSIPFDEVTYNLMIFGMLLHPRQEDVEAQLFLAEMAAARKFHPALLRLQSGFVDSYFELKEVDATPSRENLQKVAKTFWRISLLFKKRRVKELRQRLAEAASEQRRLAVAGYSDERRIEEQQELEDALAGTMSDEEDGPRVKFPARRPRQLQGVHRGSGVPKRRHHKWKH